MSDKGNTNIGNSAISPEALKVLYPVLANLVAFINFQGSVSRKDSCFGRMMHALHRAGGTTDDVLFNARGNAGSGHKGGLDAVMRKAVLQLETMPSDVNPASREKSPWPELSTDEKTALWRFCETCEDGEGYDVPKDMMKRLATIGVVHHVNAGVYEITSFGQVVIDRIEDERVRHYVLTKLNPDAPVTREFQHG